MEQIKIPVIERSLNPGIAYCGIFRPQSPDNLREIQLFGWKRYLRSLLGFHGRRMKILKTEETKILVKIIKTYSYAYKREYREYSKHLQGRNLETIDLLNSLLMNI